MNIPPLNIFQKLMRRWDAVHPYNAAQVMKIAGTPDIDQWCSAWRNLLIVSDLGTVSVHGNHYRFEELNGHDAAYIVRRPKGCLQDYLSAEINRGFDNPHETPFRPFILQKDGFFYAGIIYQHWVADSTSIRMLMHEWFVRVYEPARAHMQPMPLARWGYWNSLGRGGWPMAQGLLDLARRHSSMRRVQKIDSTSLTDYTTAFQLMPGKAGMIDHLRIAAHQRGVKINDLFLAALIQSCAAHMPMQKRKRRTDLAVGSVVDLRPWCTPCSEKVFGLFLGFTNVICKPAELTTFDHTLTAVARQMHLQKSHGIAANSLMWMSGAHWIGKLSNPKKLYHFYRKELPLAGGLSNVDLTRSWPALYHPDPLLDYIRISPTGPMTPFALTTTTLAHDFHVGITHRTGLLPSPLARSLAQTFLAQLESL